MITKARVIKKLDEFGYKWAVNIPILNGIPYSDSEYGSYKSALDVNLKNNEALAEEKRKTKAEVAEATQKRWSANNSGLLRFSTKDIDMGTGSKISDFTTVARVCGIGGIQNYINVGDTVYVGFEDNDMGSAIILGQFLSEELEDKRSQFPNLQLQNLKVLNSCDLPANTDFIGLLGLPTLTIEKLKDMEAFYDSLTALFGGNSFLSTIQGLVTNVGNMTSPPATTTEAGEQKE